MRVIIFIKRLLWVIGALTWLGIALSLGFIWIRTILDHGHDIWAYTAGEVALLIMLFLVAGFEIAYTDLRDKDPEQVDIKLQSTLKEMQQREDVLYDSREWFGVLLIVLLSLLCEFDTIFQPHFEHPFWLISRLPSVGKDLWKLVICLTFTTFPVVWFAQGPAKYFAIRNSETFLLRTRRLWPLLKVLSRVLQLSGINILSDLVLGKMSSKSRRRNLPPSDEAFYMAALKKYGCGFHQISENLYIAADGSLHLEHTGLIHVISDERLSFNRTLGFDSLPKADFYIEVTKAYSIPMPPERLIELERQIEDILLGGQGVEYLQVGDFSSSCHTDGNKPRNVIFEVGFPAPLGGVGTGKCLLLEYRLELNCEAGAFQTTRDSTDRYGMTAALPCREQSSKLYFAGSGSGFAIPSGTCAVRGNYYANEAKRVIASIHEKGKRMNFVIRFPLIGAEYSANWRLW